MNCKQQIDAVFNGSASEVNKSCNGMFQMHCYKMACEILNAPVSVRKSLLDSYPDTVRETMKEEVRRIWEYRKNNKGRAA